MSEKYLIERKYLENAIKRAYAEGVVIGMGNPDQLEATDAFVYSEVDDMIRGDKPFNEAEIFNKGFNEGLSRCEYVADRDEFARSAMAGILSRKEITSGNNGYYVLAKDTYEIAEAMLREAAK